MPERHADARRFTRLRTLGQRGPTYWLTLLVFGYAALSLLDDVRTVGARFDDLEGRILYLAGSVALSGVLVTVALRRRWLPLAFLLLATVAGLFAPQTMAMVAGYIVLFGAAYRGDRRVLLMTAALFVGNATYIVYRSPNQAAMTIFALLPAALALSVLGWLVGQSLRRRRAAEEQVEILREQAEYARERERSLLARELHDVVAHELTIIAMQATLMRLTDDPTELGQARDSIEKTARTALDELKRLLRVLRSSEVIDQATASEAHGVPAVVSALADHLRRLGHEVLTFCEVGPMPRSVELGADRVLRESVTNIVKHAAPDARCRIEVSATETSLRLAVANDQGSGGPAATLSSTRLGLPGLQERLEILGGTFTADREGSEWVVRAEIPFAPPEAAPADVAERAPTGSTT